MLKKLLRSLKIRILKLFKKNRGFFLINNTRMFLDYLDPIDREIIENQKYEQKEINFLCKFIQSNNIEYFLDIGANCGYYSIKLSNSFSYLKIIAFEPNKEAAYKFKKTLHENPDLSKQIQLKNYGLSDSMGKLEMTSLEKFGYLQTGGSEIISSKKKKIIKTKTFICDFKVGSREINLVSKNICIKIDVEGHELNVIKGLRKTLEQNCVILQVEIMENNFVNVNNYLKNYGFKWFHKITGREDWIHNHYYKNF